MNWEMDSCICSLAGPGISVRGQRTSCLATALYAQGDEGGPRLPRAVHVDVRLHERRPDARGEADADAAIREAQAVQIELLERETDALKSELLQQRLLVHRLTSYQDE